MAPLTLEQIRQRKDPKLLIEYLMSSIPGVMCEHLGLFDDEGCTSRWRKAIQQPDAENPTWISINTGLMREGLEMEAEHRLGGAFYRMNPQAAWDMFEKEANGMFGFHVGFLLSVEKAHFFVPDMDEVHAVIRVVAGEVAGIVNSRNRSLGLEEPERSADEIVQAWKASGAYDGILIPYANLLTKFRVYPGYSLEGYDFFVPERGVPGSETAKISRTTGMQLLAIDMFDGASKLGLIDQAIGAVATDKSAVLDMLQSNMYVAFLTSVAPYISPSKHADVEAVLPLLTEFNRRVQQVFDLGLGYSGNKGATISVPEGGWRWDFVFILTDGSVKVETVTIKEDWDITNLTPDFYEGLQSAAEEIGKKFVDADGNSSVYHVAFGRLPSNISEGVKRQDGSPIMSWYDVLRTEPDGVNASTYLFPMLLELQQVWSWATDSAVELSKSGGGFTLQDFSTEEVETIKASLRGELISNNREMLEAMRDPATQGLKDPQSLFFLALISSGFLRQLTAFGQIAQRIVKPPQKEIVDLYGFFGLRPGATLGQAHRALHQAYAAKGINPGRILSKQDTAMVSGINQAFAQLEKVIENYPLSLGVSWGQKSDSTALVPYEQKAPGYGPAYGFMLLSLLPVGPLAKTAFGLGLSAYLLIRMLSTASVLHDAYYDTQLGASSDAYIEGFMERAKGKTWTSFEHFKADFIREAAAADVLVLQDALGLAHQGVADQHRISVLSTPTIATQQPSPGDWHLAFGSSQSQPPPKLGDVELSGPTRQSDMTIDYIMSLIESHRPLYTSRLAGHLYSKDSRPFEKGGVAVGVLGAAIVVEDKLVDKEPRMSYDQWKSIVDYAWDLNTARIRSELGKQATETGFIRQNTHIHFDSLHDWLYGTGKNRGIFTEGVYSGGSTIYAGPLSLEGLAITVFGILGVSWLPDPQKTAEDLKREEEEKAREIATQMNEEGVMQTILGSLAGQWTGAQRQDTSRERITTTITGLTSQMAGAYLNQKTSQYQLNVAAGFDYQILRAAGQGALTTEQMASFFNPATELGRAFTRLEAAGLLGESDIEEARLRAPHLFPKIETAYSGSVITQTIYSALFLPDEAGKTFIDRFIDSHVLVKGQPDLGVDLAKVIADLWAEINKTLQPVDQLCREIQALQREGIWSSGSTR